MADIIDLIKQSYDEKPSDFMSSFNDLMALRALGALQQAKQDVAMTMFAQEQEPVQPEEIDQELDDSSIDLEDNHVDSSEE